MFSDYAIQEIRLLPMSREKEFPAWDDVKAFLDRDFASEHHWKYWYRERGIDLEDMDALILFQYDAQIVGYGVFRTRVKHELPPEEVNGEMVVYRGYNAFYPNSVKRIKPVASREIAEIDPGFRRFCQSMKKIDVKYLPDLCRLLRRKALAR